MDPVAPSGCFNPADRFLSTTGCSVPIPPPQSRMRLSIFGGSFHDLACIFGYSSSVMMCHANRAMGSTTLSAEIGSWVRHYETSINYRRLSILQYTVQYALTCRVKTPGRAERWETMRHVRTATGVLGNGNTAPINISPERASSWNP